MNSLHLPELRSTESLAGFKRKPRLGFLGVGWIGRNRMEAVAASGAAEVIAVADAAPELATAACSVVPHARWFRSLDELLEVDLDGIVIATPSALHAKQAIAALEAGRAVFCQKPLGRNAGEVQSVLGAARKADRLLGLDLSYRHVEGIRKIRDIVHAGELGEIYAVDVVFHNAYGPDKPWFYDRTLSGGGCVIDLGIHLVDLALWMLGFPRVERVSSRLFSQGAPWRRDGTAVEDYGLARIDLEQGTTIQLACSWKLHAGCNAEIRANLFGRNGGAGLRNVDGSFYDFVAEQWRGTTRKRLAEPPDAWGGRAIVDWAERLGQGNGGYDSSSDEWLNVAEVLDAIYRCEEGMRFSGGRLQSETGKGPGLQSELA